MNTTVVAMTFADQSVVDPNVMADLFARLGEEGADAVLMGGLEQVETRFKAISKAYFDGNHRSAADLARALGQLADQMGLVTIARVATDLAEATEAEDHHAFAAISGRMARLIRPKSCGFLEGC